MMAPIAAVSCLVFMALVLVGEVRRQPTLSAVSKPLASGSFLAAALWWGAAGAGWPGRLVLAGLALSAVGDVLLLWRDRPRFAAGLGAFLLAHVAYTAAFAALGLSIVGLALWSLPLLVVGLRVWQWLAPHVGRMRVPVLAYMVAISAMVAAAAAAATASPSPARAILAIAAIAFFASDLAVARDRFVSRGPENRLFGLPLYYLAQLAFGAWVVAA